MLLRVLLLALVGFVLWRWGRRLLTRTTSDRQGRHALEDTPWSVLGVKPGASQQEIHAAYQAKIAAYHPDKVASLGKKLQHVAETETRRINKAYDMLSSP